MALKDQRYTVRLPLPDAIVRATEHTIYAPVYLDGNLVAPTGGGSSTVSVYNAANTAVVDGATAVISGSVAEYDIPAATIPATLAVEEGWRVEWSLVISGGPTLTPRNKAALVRNDLWPVISDEDIWRRVPALDPGRPGVITTMSSHQWAIDEAWTELQLEIYSRGNRPNLILEPSALRSTHLALTLYYVFDNLSHRLNPAHREAADQFRDDYRQALSRVAFDYDVGDDGRADNRRRAGTPTINLSGGRNVAWTSTRYFG